MLVLVPVSNISTREHKTDSWRILKPVLDYESCIRCMICWKFCPDNAIEISSEAKVPYPNERIAKMEAPIIDYDHCKGCGICANECPVNSISMILEETGV